MSSLRNILTSLYFSLGLSGCFAPIHGQVNLVTKAAVSADTFLTDHPPAAAIDGDTVDNSGWAASALDTIYPGKVNIAPSATATASAFHEGNGGYFPEEAIDGIIGPWQAWAASDGQQGIPQWLEMTWPSSQTFDSVVLYTNPLNDGGYALRGYTVQYWDGTGYRDLDTVSGNKSAVVTSTFDAVTARRIRILCTEADSLSSFYRISELEVYTKVKMAPHWLDLTWNSAQTVSKLMLFTSSDPGHTLKGFEILYWDGDGFHLRTSVSGNTDSKVVCRFPSISTTKLRIKCTEPDASDSWYRINEVEVYDDPLPSIDDSTWNLDLETIDYFFASPPNQYRTVQYTLNQDLQQGIIDRLLDYGFGGIQTMSPSINYQYLLDEEGWSKTAGDVDLALANDMKVWIHDELGYPSGAAGGLVVEGYPEYENRGLFRLTQKGRGTVDIAMDLPPEHDYLRASLCLVVEGEPDYENVAEVPIVNKQISTMGLAGDWQLSVFGILILDENTQAQTTIEQFGQTGHFPSLLNRDACARFVELTHQNYADHLGEIDKKVELFYTNEPNLMTLYFSSDLSDGDYAYVAWENDLPNQFKAMHGYDLIPRLDALFGGFSNRSKTVRLNFQQTVGEVMARNFTGQITEWCHANGIKSSGHFLLEEYMIYHAICYGDFMKVIRKLDVPACDLPIARPDKVNWHFWMPKFISSAAYLENKHGLVDGLIDPIIGYGSDDMSPDIPYLQRTFNLAFLCGINQVNSYIPFTEYMGEEKEQHIRLQDHIARVCLMLRGAENEAPIAMYYPIETYQTNYIPSGIYGFSIYPTYDYLQKTLNRMAVEILQNGLDFNYVTADAILNASVEGSTVKVGEHRYSSIVMPRAEVIPLEVLQKLQTISEAGIPVHWVDGLPSLGTRNSEHEQVKQIASTLETINDPLPDLLMIRDEEFSLQIQSSDSLLYMARFSRDGHMIYYIVNDAEHEITITAESENTDTLRVYDPGSGTIRVSTLPLSELLGGYESLFLVEKLSADSTVETAEPKPEVRSPVRIYPNPADNHVTIEIPAGMMGTGLFIFDITGRAVLSQRITSGISVIDISGLSPGIYFIRDMKDSCFGKLIKN